jgi:hypothetical protein
MLSWRRSRQEPLFPSCQIFMFSNRMAGQFLWSFFKVHGSNLTVILLHMVFESSCIWAWLFSWALFSCASVPLRNTSSHISMLCFSALLSCPSCR